MKIRVSIMLKSFDEALKLIEKSERYGVDFIEVRLDRIGNSKGLKEIAGCTETPLIVTVRTPGCGGKFMEEEAERVKVLLNAASSGFKYVE